LDVNNGNLVIGTAEVKLDIDEVQGIAFSREGVNSVESIKIIESDDGVYFSVKGKKEAKLFGLFPVDVEVNANINVETGEVSGVEES
jgi:hypothetical protein